MSVVSDTTAITTLRKAGHVRLLQELFERIFVPQAVWDELKAFHSDLPGFVELHLVSNPGQRLTGTIKTNGGLYLSDAVIAEALRIADEF
jgi:predicted nucleic acid-binding protein